MVLPCQENGATKISPSALLHPGFFLLGMGRGGAGFFPVSSPKKSAPYGVKRSVRAPTKVLEKSQAGGIPWPRSESLGSEMRCGGVGCELGKERNPPVNEREATPLFRVGEYPSPGSSGPGLKGKKLGNGG